MKVVAVIGLGKFGFYIAKSLSRLNVKVIAVDNDEKKVQEISEYVDNSYILDSTSKIALEEIGIYNLNTVIVSIGANIEASILTVMALKDLNNKHVIAKAITSTHGEILSKIGAFKVIYPEKIAGRLLVKKLIDNITIEEIDIDSQADLIDAISEVIERVKTKKKWIGGKVEKIRVNVSAFKNESQLYYKEKPTEFNYLLTE